MIRNLSLNMGENRISEKVRPRALGVRRLVVPPRHPSRTGDQISSRQEAHAPQERKCKRSFPPRQEFVLRQTVGEDCEPPLLPADRNEPLHRRDAGRMLNREIRGIELLLRSLYHTELRIDEDLGRRDLRRKEHAESLIAGG